MKLEGKKVLVTGADGFIGSHLVEALLKENCEITALSYYNSFNTWGWLDTLEPNALKSIRVLSGDIRDSGYVREAARGQDVIFHLAALIAIPFSYHAPDSYIDTNIKGTLNVLQTAREFEIEKTLITSTSEVYGTALKIPIDENHARQGQSPYSASKIGADSLAESFYRSFKTPLTIVRPFNTYGPRQSARAIIPTIITQLLDGSNEIKIGDERPTRDFVYVKDTVQGFIEIAKSDKLIGEECNISTNQEVSIGDLVKNLVNIINPSAKVINEEIRMRPKDSEVFRLLGDNSKLKSHTNWKMNYNLEKGLKETIEWFKDDVNRKQYKSDIYNI